MGTKTYPIWEDKIFSIGTFAGVASIDVRKDIKWNEVDTQVYSAELDISIRCSRARTYAKIIVNGQDVKTYHWPDGSGGQTTGSVEDVIGLLRNGSNTFEIVGWKGWFVPAVVEYRVTIHLVVSYEGETPTVKPWYEKYALPLGISIGLGTAVVGALLEVKWGRKRMIGGVMP